MPERIQRRRTKGWRLPAGAVVVSRPTRWGNPYRTGPQWMGGTTQEVVTSLRAIELYVWLANDRIRREGRAIWAEPLRGRDLACWCPLDQPCHADVLLELANA